MDDPREAGPVTPSLQSYPIPANDRARVEIINAMMIERRRKDPFFEHVTEAAKTVFGTPIAYVSLMQRETQRLLHCNGADVEGTPREASLCAFTVAAKQTIVIHDTWQDARSVDHPAVVDNNRLRFSASAPVILSSGFCVGTLCAVDLVPHEAPDAGQIAVLEHLAAMIARFYEAPAEPDPARLAEIGRIAHEAQEEFLALIGHELRTPLNGICGLLPLLEPANAEEAEIRDAIDGSADLLTRVVNSILFYTELSSADIEIEESAIDLAELLRRTTAGHQALMRIGDKTCDMTGIPECLPYSGDREKLELAFSCLLANVVVHGGRNARVSLGVDENGIVEIAIGDDGPGITAERESRIWHAFGTGEAVRTRRADGIGLGLPLTRRLIELHGGDVTLDQTGGGLAVRIRLPAWRMRVAEVAA
ncbi:HAMP domain-containing sensor histidine kinase [Palleronia sp. LCG004]|uniref:GAF domain-containing sensor histidine kinase n=1 Tax=Palleronia sp. LCG004 TaxID=3079304 RepID=UPI002943F62B|nr:HAMP domain-containing sensor histidine kinase [Palleronia sp. LCG004]WOI58054.1 HAMP domain-containing sensor histidine kinase [Palleronia sp. LCG004]